MLSNFKKRWIFVEDKSEDRCIIFFSLINSSELKSVTKVSSLLFLLFHSFFTVCIQYTCLSF